jgi:2-methylisocitrate lyase-like PEP mutase family enzyme
MTDTIRKQFRARLKQASLIVAPGIYDAYGARMAEQAGFEAAYLTGNGVSASQLGWPDVGLVDLTLLTQQAHRVAACVSIPVICDADTGYGNAVNVRHTVREFEATGVAAIHIEDQLAPKRCGHLPGARPVIELGEAVGKIEAAVAARRDDDFVIIARTDSATGHGLEEAIRRVQAFHKAGADVLFVELKTSATILEDMKRVTGSVPAPCLINIDGGGTLGALTAAEIGQLGYRVAIYPGLQRYAAGFATAEAMAALKRDGSTKAVSDRMFTMQQYNQVLKLGEIEQWEKQYMQSR